MGLKNHKNKWEVVSIQVDRNTYIVSANDRWEALRKSLNVEDKPTIKEKLESVTESITPIRYS
tara:strand:+ start:2079 stop:2267 length:189 start_codon:yes stop_codon:yes gene_type:complete